MKTLGRIFLTLTCIGLFTLVVSLINNKPVEATNPQSVIVTNTPLPVQGSISVGNTPSVNIANTPSVNVANTPSVTLSGNASVANAVGQDGATIPLTVMLQGQPYQDWCKSTTSGDCFLQAVPANMRLVIQEVDLIVQYFNPTDSRTGGLLQVTFNNKTAAHFLVLTAQGTAFNEVFFSTHQATTLYADGNTSPQCAAAFDGDIDHFQCSISGYLAPAQ